MKRIEYLSIDLAAPCRVFIGKAKVSDVAAVRDVTIVRVIDGPTDIFEVKGSYVTPNYEIEARNVTGGVRKPVKDVIAVRGTGGKASKDAEA
jgi:hypothetical protein